VIVNLVCISNIIGPLLTEKWELSEQISDDGMMPYLQSMKTRQVN
jgi:hypothetical protein